MPDSASPGEPRGIRTIGHADHALPAFLDLLTRHGVQVLADIRAQRFAGPGSPFGSVALKGGVKEADILYVFLGEELRGRPPEDEYYDSKGTSRTRPWPPRRAFAKGSRGWSAASNATVWL